MATPKWYSWALVGAMAGSIDLDTDNFNLMLATNAYVPDQTAHKYRSAATTAEATAGTGYTSGGWALTNKTVAQSTLDAVWDVGDLSQGIGGTLNFRYGIYYKNRGGAATADELVAYVDFVGGAGTQSVIDAVLNITNTNPLKLTAS